MPRRYEQRRRAGQSLETRRRIVEATSELHGTVGFVEATISAVAERAGVQRLTVYRHFPTERELVGACAFHFFDRHPFPDPGPWAELADPEERLRVALAEVYAWFRAAEGHMANLLRDAPAKPFLLELGAPMFAHWDRMLGVLARGWKARGRQRRLLMLALGHALDFRTWQALARGREASDGEAVELMARLVAAAKTEGRSRGPQVFGNQP